MPEIAAVVAKGYDGLMLGPILFRYAIVSERVKRRKVVEGKTRSEQYQTFRRRRAYVLQDLPRMLDYYSRNSGHFAL